MQSFPRALLASACAQNLMAPYEMVTAGWANLRTEIGFRQKLSPGLGIEEVRLGIVGDNFLDDEIHNSASFKKDQILLPGRGIRAHLAFRF